MKVSVVRCALLACGLAACVQLTSSGKIDGEGEVSPSSTGEIAVAALMHESPFDDFHAECTGSFVGPNAFLSAGHCVRGRNSRFEVWKPNSEGYRKMQVVNVFTAENAKVFGLGVFPDVALLQVDGLVSEAEIMQIGATEPGV